MPPHLPRKAALTILFFVAFASLLARGKLLQPPHLTALLEFEPRAVAAPDPDPPRPETTRTAARPNTPSSSDAQSVPIHHPAAAHLSDSNHALAAFYTSLDRTASGAHVTRILHYGDSPITADSITADLRSLLQERFGDAGHGFVLVAKPWGWYGHHGVQIHSSGWKTEPASQGDRVRDGRHGLGGVACEGGPGSHSEIKLETSQDRVELQYMTQPGGGAITLRTGATILGTVDTNAPEAKPAWVAFPLPVNTTDVALDVSAGHVRVYGLRFEKGNRGVVYSSLGLNGASVQVLLRYFDAASWTEAMQHENPDLVVLNYGTNESAYPKYVDSTYPGELRAVIERVKKAVPKSSILIMGPMDRGLRSTGGSIITMPALPHVVEIQKQIAAETGCAFFNTFQAMGGEGTMARWYTNHPQLVTADFIHPFPAGARKIGLLVNDALMNGFERHKGGRAALTAPEPAPSHARLASE